MYCGNFELLHALALGYFCSLLRLSIKLMSFFSNVEDNNFIYDTESSILLSIHSFDISFHFRQLNNLVRFYPLSSNCANELHQ
jgi:hypothetical protein